MTLVELKHHIELKDKARELREQGKSEDEIVELLRDDIKQAAEYCFNHPEEMTGLKSELLNSDSPMMAELLFGIIGGNSFGPSKTNKNE